MGNTTHSLSLEQLVQESCDLAPALTAGEERAYLRRPEVRRILQETVANLRAALERMDQTPEHENLLRTLARLVREKRLHVRLYTRGRLQGRAYIFDPASQSGQDAGVGLVGSSNLTLAALRHATDLDVLVRGRENHSALVRWFDSLWEEAQDLSAALLDELQQCWALAATPPYDIFMKTLYVLLKDRMEAGQDGELFGGDEIDARLADFQRVAVRQATGMIREHGGAFVADVVGLGKSYIGAAVVKHFEQSEGARPLILCPAPLVEMWERYNEVYQLHARVLSLGLLRAGADETGASSILDDVKYRDRDFVLLDESHHFRHSDT
jgi:PLD-like domain